MTLSTSKTSFTGLGDPIPELKPWNLRLWQANTSSYQALYSPQEQAERSKTAYARTVGADRSELFGVAPDDSASDSGSDEMSFALSSAYMPVQAAVPPPPPAPIAARFGGAAESKKKSSGFGSNVARGGALFGSTAPPGAAPLPQAVAPGDQDGTK